MSFDRVGVFRHFLRPLRDQGTLILFDLQPDVIADRWLTVGDFDEMLKDICIEYLQD